MASGDMVVVDGIRYRAEDAKRLGLVADDRDKGDKKAAPKPHNKARSATNKEG